MDNNIKSIVDYTPPMRDQIFYHISCLMRIQGESQGTELNAVTDYILSLLERFPKPVVLDEAADRLAKAYWGMGAASALDIRLMRRALQEAFGGHISISVPHDPVRYASIEHKTLMATAQGLDRDLLKAMKENDQLRAELEKTRAELEACNSPFETRADGITVRKDRWEKAFRAISSRLIGCHEEFEVVEQMHRVIALVEGARELRSVCIPTEKEAEARGYVKLDRLGASDWTVRQLAFFYDRVQAAMLKVDNLDPHTDVDEITKLRAEAESKCIAPRRDVVTPVLPIDSTADAEIDRLLQDRSSGKRRVINAAQHIELKDFGWAIKKLKEGCRVTRSGWNGKGMWLALMPGFVIPKGMINERTRKFVSGEKDLDCGAYIVMWTAQGVWQPGWLANQADMLAEDWELVENMDE